KSTTHPESDKLFCVLRGLKMIASTTICNGGTLFFSDIEVTSIFTLRIRAHRMGAVYHSLEQNGKEFDIFISLCKFPCYTKMAVQSSSNIPTKQNVTINIIVIIGDLFEKALREHVVRVASSRSTNAGFRYEYAYYRCNRRPFYETRDIRRSQQAKHITHKNITRSADCPANAAEVSYEHLTDRYVLLNPPSNKKENSIDKSMGLFILYVNAPNASCIGFQYIESNGHSTSTLTKVVQQSAWNRHFATSDRYHSVNDTPPEKQANRLPLGGGKGNPRVTQQWYLKPKWNTMQTRIPSRIPHHIQFRQGEQKPLNDGSEPDPRNIEPVPVGPQYIVCCPRLFASTSYELLSSVTGVKVVAQDPDSQSLKPDHSEPESPSYTQLATLIAGDSDVHTIAKEGRLQPNKPNTIRQIRKLLAGLKVQSSAKTSLMGAPPKELIGAATQRSKPQRDTFPVKPRQNAKETKRTQSCLNFLNNSKSGRPKGVIERAKK
ncbi:hypothetical protein CLF_113583, partial [Clonorchis sinensis]